MKRFARYVNALSTSPERRLLLDLAREGVETVMPERFIPGNVAHAGHSLLVGGREFPLGGSGRRVFVIGAGKASAAMAVELERVLGPERIAAGMVISTDSRSKPERIVVREGDHPLPSELNAMAAREMLSMKDRYRIGADDLIIALLSGGGSSLMPLPPPGITIDEKRRMVKALIRSGANVHEITIVKKKASAVKGGKLAMHFAPTPIVSLVLSDVVDSDPTVIASGPFAEDTSSYEDACRIIERHGVREDIPPSILEFFESRRHEPPPRQDLRHVHQVILSSNDIAVDRVEAEARKRGLDVRVKKRVEGEARDVARRICADIRRERVSRPTLFLYGGETTVTLGPVHGRGGRCQEFALACLAEIAKNPMPASWTGATIATDGVDFIPDSMGAVFDEATLARVSSMRLDPERYLALHDSNRFLARVGALLESKGPTGTNVGDLYLLLVSPRR